MTPTKLLEEQLMKLDKDISEVERALLHLNKQVGKKMSELCKLKQDRTKVSDAYKELNNQLELPLGDSDVRV